MAADREHRSIANMVEVMIRDYCGRNGVTIPEQGALFDGAPESHQAWQIDQDNEGQTS